ncbi:MAG: type II toxin-antitoxin system RelE/ParE family toxin [Alphaproteobacteria bacterium]|nr:type II toxin-antitoxin system RelE/ParE family toxin [Alphaproteobacteria bacterium]
MTWKIKIRPNTEKQLEKLDREVQKRVLSFLYKRLLPSNNPRQFGKALRGRMSGYWSYRVGDYRIIADIQDHHLTVVAVSINHRRQVYI